MKTWILINLYSVFCSGLFAQNLDDWFKQVDRFFQQYIENGLVDYQRLANHKEDIRQPVNAMKSIDLSKLPAEHQKAFWINAYNLLVIYQIVKHFPVNSPLDIKGFFDQNRFEVAGEWLTLDEIEKEKLLETTGDERVHFILVCAARSCPPLAAHAYLPGHLETQIANQTRKVLNDPGFIQINHEQKAVVLPEIFKWYEQDFLKKSPSVVDYIDAYRTNPLPKGYKVVYSPYDWSLNKKKL